MQRMEKVAMNINAVQVRYIRSNILPEKRRNHASVDGTRSCLHGDYRLSCICGRNATKDQLSQTHCPAVPVQQERKYQ